MNNFLFVCMNNVLVNSTFLLYKIVMIIMTMRKKNIPIIFDENKKIGELIMIKKPIFFLFHILRKGQFSMEYQTTTFTRCHQLENERIMQTNRDE
jgi:hypothetical protein